MNDPRRFHVLQHLGSGGFGSVYLAEMQEGATLRRRVALKIHEHGDRDSLRRFRDEARLLARLHHRALVPVLALLQLEPGWTMVLEWVDGADLSEILALGPVPPRVVMELLHEVSDALITAWHTPSEAGTPLRLLHRDIKPANLRATVHGDLRLLDLGAARADLPGREGLTTRLGSGPGTRHYAAPERWAPQVVHEEEPPDDAPDLHAHEVPEGDVWSLGMVAIDLLRSNERAPKRVDRPHRDALVRRLPQVLEQLVPEASVEARDDVVALIDVMTTWDPADRPTMEQVRDRAARLLDQLPGPTPRTWLVAAVREAQARRVPGEEPDPSWVGKTLTPLAPDAAPPGVIRSTVKPKRAREAAQTSPAQRSVNKAPGPSKGKRLGALRRPAAVEVAVAGEPAPTGGTIPADPGPVKETPPPRSAWAPLAAGALLAAGLAAWAIGAPTTSAPPAVEAPPPSPAEAPALVLEPAAPAAETIEPPVPVWPRPGPATTPRTTHPPTPSTESSKEPSVESPPPPPPPPAPAAPALVQVRLEDSPYPSLSARAITGATSGAIPGQLPPGSYKLFAGDSYKGTITLGAVATATVHCSVGQQQKCTTR